MRSETRKCTHKARHGHNHLENVYDESFSIEQIIKVSTTEMHIGKFLLKKNPKPLKIFIVSQNGNWLCSLRSKFKGFAFGSRIYVEM